MIKYSIKIIKNFPFQLTAFCLALFLSGCSKTPEGTEYFPLQKGLRYTYKVTTEYTGKKESRLTREYPGEKHESRLTIDNLGKKSVGDKTYFVRRTSSGIDYYINSDSEGIYREALRTLVELKPRLDKEKRFIIKRPVAVGTEWRMISGPVLLMRVYPYRQRAGDKAQVPMHYRIENLNSTVTVSAGTFENCIKIYGEGSFKAYTDAVSGETDIPISVEEWYAKGVGLVKQVRYELEGDVINVFNTPIFIGGKTTLELESFDD
ncbi:MAG: hypothetical protein MI865_07355 [Proteobacteria bacterium]|nr:hypothetical protein [Pseudomonadota bacterium]